MKAHLGRGHKRFSDLWSLWKLVLLFCVTLLLFGSDLVVCKKKKSGKKKLKVLRVTKPAPCDVVVDEKAIVGFYYSAQFQNGTLAIKDTSYVGRPDEIDMSTEKQGIIKAIQKGLKGACNGEKRRIVVPPLLYRDESSPPDEYAHETILLDVFVVTINHVVYDGDEGSEEALSSSGAKASRSPVETCGACMLFVKKFIRSWYVEMARNIEEVKNNGGTEPPALSYNDNMEKMVQTLCSSDLFLHEKKYSSYLTTFCEKIMTVHKRNIVEKAMRYLSDLHQSWASFSNDVCGVMTKSCPLLKKEEESEEEAAASASECDTCKVLVREVEYLLSMHGPKMLAKPIEKRVWSILVDLCSTTKYSHFNPYKAGDLCEDMVEEHGKVLVQLIAENHRGEGNQISSSSGSGSVGHSFCTHTKSCQNYQDKALPEKEEL